MSEWGWWRVTAGQPPRPKYAIGQRVAFEVVPNGQRFYYQLGRIVEIEREQGDVIYLIREDDGVYGTHRECCVVAIGDDSHLEKAKR